MPRVCRLRTREKRIRRHEYCECWFFCVCFLWSFLVWIEFTFLSLYLCVFFLFEMDNNGYNHLYSPNIHIHDSIAFHIRMRYVFFDDGGFDQLSMTDFQDLQAGKNGQRQLVENIMESMQSVSIVWGNQRIHQRIWEPRQMGEHLFIDYPLEWCKHKHTYRLFSAP